jgi:hypothetical protein
VQAVSINQASRNAASRLAHVLQMPLRMFTGKVGVNQTDGGGALTDGCCDSLD